MTIVTDVVTYSYETGLSILSVINKGYSSPKVSTFINDVQRGKSGYFLFRVFLWIRSVTPSKRETCFRRDFSVERLDNVLLILREYKFIGWPSSHNYEGTCNTLPIINKRSTSKSLYSCCSLKGFHSNIRNLKSVCGVEFIYVLTFHTF